MCIRDSYVSSETKEKVYKAIAELGYTPDASARSFRTGKKRTIGFIVPDIANKFFATMIESVENYLSAHGYQLIIANTKEDMDREETNIRLLTAGLVDGLLIASTMDDFQRFDELIPAGFPVVLVDRTFETKKYSSVCVSNFQPIYRSVCRLAGKGDRRIGIIGGLPRLSTTVERISAYQQAMADCGLPEDPDLIRYGDSMEKSAAGCLEELLERKCDAIIVCQGLMASETIIYLHQKGIQLAQDIDLVSFVDYDAAVYALYADQMDTIIQPVEELGDMPEFGMLFKLNADYDRLEWYGLGPQETYADRRCGAKLGVYKNRVADNMAQYLVPQECGNKVGVRYAKVTDERGRGMLFTGDELSFSALPYTPHELENAMHAYELPEVHYTVVRVALAQMGIGGDDSWGAPVHPEYHIDVTKPLTLRFGFRGI